MPKTHNPKPLIPVESGTFIGYLEGEQYLRGGVGAEIDSAISEMMIGQGLWMSGLSGSDTPGNFFKRDLKIKAGAVGGSTHEGFSS
jgi:hypothetical protein